MELNYIVYQGLLCIQIGQQFELYKIVEMQYDWKWFS